MLHRSEGRAHPGKLGVALAVDSEHLLDHRGQPCQLLVEGPVVVLDDASDDLRDGPGLPWRTILPRGGHGGAEVAPEQLETHTRLAAGFVEWTLAPAAEVDAVVLEIPDRGRMIGRHVLHSLLGPISIPHLGWKVRHWLLRVVLRQGNERSRLAFLRGIRLASLQD